MVEGFLLGVIATAALAAGLTFLKFWRATRDMFFLAFAAAFILEGLDRVTILFLARPSHGNPWIYTVRLFAYILILAAILKKNYSRKG